MAKLSARQREELAKGTLKATSASFLVVVAQSLAGAPGAAVAIPLGVAAVLLANIERQLSNIASKKGRSQFITNLREQGATNEEIEKIMSVLERDEF